MVPIAPGVGLTKVRRIDHPNGNILHALKSSETSFVSFGEAYFSQIMPNCIKGWKKHTEMTLNIVVPVGDIKFYFAAEIEQSYEPLGHISIGDLNYQRLTIAPGVWIARNAFEHREYRT
jgi:dTDP-4-dehydrorhamnose 3,5-epimerase